MKVSIKVDGLSDLDKALSELPKAAAAGVLRRIALRALAPFVEAVRRKAPVDEDPASTPNRPPGTLRDSYRASTRLNKTQRRQVKRAGKSFAEVYAGTGDPAGVQTEFGNAHQAAQPHARPAWDETQDEALRIVKDELGEEIEKTANRLAKRRLKAKGKL